MMEIKIEFEISEKIYKIEGKFPREEIGGFMELLKYIHASGDNTNTIEVNFNPNMNLKSPLITKELLNISGRRGCTLCMKPLTGRQTKWCSNKCRVRFNRKFREAKA